MKKVGIIGITGKVGAILSQMVLEDSELELVGGISRKSAPVDFLNLAKHSDVLIDFSSPDASIQAAAAAAGATGAPLVCGTTGISAENFKKIENYSKITPIFYASNFCIAIHIMASLLKRCSKALSEYDISLTDKHHKNKKDAPSGTSVFLAKQLGREAQMLSIRAGDVPAEMICEFCGKEDMLTISHRAFGRGIYAKGAIACAKWLIGKTPRMYSMQDYVNARN